MKRKLCLLLSVVLILTLFPVYAFADDPEESNSSGDSDVINDEIIDSELQSIANNLYQIQLLNDTRATTYTATDIYNFMVNHFLMGGAQNGYMYQIYSFVTSLNTKVQAIMTYANSIREYTELIHDSVTGDNTVITLYDLIGDHLGNIANMLGVTEGNTTLSTAELLLLINNTIDDSYLALGNIQSTLDSIQNNIALLYAVMTDIAESNNDIVTQTTNVNANLASIISRLQLMQSDFNNVNWDYSISGSVVDSSDNSLSSVTFINTSNYNQYFIKFNLSTTPNNSLYRFVLPIYINSRLRTNNYIVHIYNGPNISNIYEISSNYIYTYFNDYRRLEVLLFNSYFDSTNVYIMIEPISNSDGFSLNPSYSSSLNILQSNNIDFYPVYDFLDSRVKLDIYNKFQMLYASDDLIAAKQDQQGYEDQAIEDFTGSGSAAAKGSDLTDMKSISGALKQGLSSGGSVANALSPFNTNSGFWAWFSQSNYDDINNLSTPSLRSGNPRNEPEIINFYNDNQLTLQGLLSGGIN